MFLHFSLVAAFAVPAPHAPSRGVLYTRRCYKGTQCFCNSFLVAGVPCPGTTCSVTRHAVHSKLYKRYTMFLRFPPSCPCSLSQQHRPPHMACCTFEDAKVTVSVQMKNAMVIGSGFYLRCVTSMPCCQALLPDEGDCRQNPSPTGIQHIIVHPNPA